MTTAVKEKHCTKCDQTKKAVEFSANSARPTGLGDWCKDCNNKFIALFRDKVNTFLLNWKEANNLDCSRKDAAILYGVKNQRNIDNFKSKIVVTETGCHIYTGYAFSNGYGGFNVHIESGMHSVCVKAHRFAFALEYGWLPTGRSGNTKDGIVLNHRCHNRLCQNPDHLEAVTVAVNNSPAKRKPKSLQSA